MITWDNISLNKFQQVKQLYANDTLSDIDKVLFSVCAVFDMTEFRLNNAPVKKASSLIWSMKKLMEVAPEYKPVKKIGKHIINYDPGTITLGQYITIMFYIGNDAIANAHKILSTISNDKKGKYDPEKQAERSDFYLEQPVSKILGTLKTFIESFAAFNKSYNGLFGVSTSDAGEVESDPFHKRYGWIYSATMVADHNRFTLDEAMGTPIRVAFNDLAFLKAKAQYDEKLLKRK